MVASAPSDKTEVIGGPVNVDNDCYDSPNAYPQGIRVCYSAKGVWHEVRTRHGFNYQANFQYECYVITDLVTGVELYHWCAENTHYLDLQPRTAVSGEIQTNHFLATLSYSTDGSISCINVFHYHATWDREQFSRYSTTC